jgi:hypothetical protein
MFSSYTGWQLVWLALGCAIGPAIIALLASFVTFVPRRSHASPESTDETAGFGRTGASLDPSAHERKAQRKRG